MKAKAIIIISCILLVACGQKKTESNAGGTDSLSENVKTGTSTEYQFTDGYPDATTIKKAYDEADLNRAIQTYRFFYPSVSIMATWEGNLANGVVPNNVCAILDSTPDQLVFTPNSDTKYAGLAIDLSNGPMIVDVPPGPIMSAVND